MKKVLIIALSIAMFACKSDKKENTDEEESYVIPSSEKSGSASPLQESVARGKELYSDLCATCHLPNGKGIPGTYPPLDASDWLTEKREASIHGVKFGLQGEITVNGEKYDNLMPPMGLTDQEVADALNYAMNSWSNNIGDMVTAKEVAAIKE